MIGTLVWLVSGVSVLHDVAYTLRGELDGERLFQTLCVRYTDKEWLRQLAIATCR